MDDSKWERWSAFGGILFVVLLLVSGFLPGSPPKTSDSAAKIAKFIADKQSRVRWAGYIGTLASAVGLWWLGAVWRMVRRAEGGTPRLAVVAVTGGVFASVASAIGGVVLGAMGIVGPNNIGGAGATRLWYVVSSNLGVITTIGIAVLTFAVSAVVLRTGVLPSVVGWFGGLVTLASLVGAATVASTRDAFFSVALASFIGFALWALVLSILMYRAVPSGAGATSTATMAPSPA